MTVDLTDEEQAILYQLEKVDQGGDVTDLIEEAKDRVAMAFDLEYEEDEESPYYMMLKLPNGRYADMFLSAEIIDPKEERNEEQEANQEAGKATRQKRDGNPQDNGGARASAP